MSDGKWDEITAKAKVKQHGGDIKGKQITIKRAGIRLWGAIDFLCNHCGYSFYKEEKQYG
jgi:hypothetical protein